MRFPIWLFAIGFSCLIGIFPNAAPAQEKSDNPEKIDSGFRCYVVVDKRYELKSDHNRTGSFHCPICDNGLFPVLAVFSRSVPAKEDDPIVALLQKQEELGKKYKSARLGTFAIFLTLTKDYPDDADREKSRQAIAVVGQQAKLEQVLLGLAEATVDEEGKPVPSPQVKAFKIADSDDVTVLLYNRLKVVERWKFAKDQPPSAADLDKIAAAVDKLLSRKKK